MSAEQELANANVQISTLISEVTRWRDASAGLNSIYPTVTEGRQSVGDGKYFSVPGNGAYMRLYRRQGSSAELIAEFPDVATLNSMIDQLGPLLGRGVVGGGDLLSRDVYGLGSFGREVGSSNYLSPDIPLGAQANGFRSINHSSYPVGLPEELQQSWASVLLNKRNSSVGAGILQSITNDVIFFRVVDEEIDRVYRAMTSGNVLSPVGIADGIPSGGLFEYGENASGRYLKIADGTLICTSPVVLDYGTNGWQYFPFPYEFVGALPTGCIGFSSTAGSVTSRRKAVSLSLSNLGQGRLLYNTTGTTLGTVEGITEDVTVTAFGRWY